VLRLALLGALLAAPALAKDRVSEARKATQPKLVELFKAAGVAYPAAQLYFRVFKTENEVEMWAADKGQPLALIKKYPICYASGELGPKRQEGDLQVPEGFYAFDQFNATSDYHLAMRVSYPNPSDRVLGTKGKLGGLIYMHGACASIGCIAMTDPLIEELYLAALDAREKNKRDPPVHIFPRRMDDEGMKALEAIKDEKRLAFWKQLLPAYLAFEKTRRLPVVKIDAKTGAYSVAGG
jgi:murein L,D-transpeptidase YafK